MPINAVSNENKCQNNMYAGIGAGTGMVVGSTIGYLAAPRAAKSLDELLTCKPDVFEKTIGNMQKKGGLESAHGLTLSAARATIDAVEERMKLSFPDEIMSMDEFSNILVTKEKELAATSYKIETYFGSLLSNQGGTTSVEKIYQGMVKEGILGNEAYDAMTSMLDESLLKAEVPISEEFCDYFSNLMKKASDAGKMDLDMYKGFKNLEKDGFILRKDIIESAKKSTKPMADNMLSRQSFDTFKKFIPKTGQMKWAAIGGVGLAAITAGAIKLFGGKTKEA